MKLRLNLNKSNNIYIFTLMNMFTLLYVICLKEWPQTYDNNVNLLGLNYIIIIFLNNVFNFILFSGFAYLGSSIPFILKFIITCITSGMKFRGNMFLYFICSLPHGIIEFLVMYYIFSFSFNIFHGYYMFIKKSDSTYILKITKKFFTKDIIIIIIMLLFAAILEVCISNRLIYYISFE